MLMFTKDPSFFRIFVKRSTSKVATTCVLTKECGKCVQDLCFSESKIHTESECADQSKFSFPGKNTARQLSVSDKFGAASLSGAVCCWLNECVPQEIGYLHQSDHLSCDVCHPQFTFTPRREGASNVNNKSAFPHDRKPLLRTATSKLSPTHESTCVL